MDFVSQLSATTKPLFEALAHLQSSIVVHSAGSSTFQVQNESYHAANAANCAKWKEH